MKSLLLRFYRWLGRLLGQETKSESRDTTATGHPPAAVPPTADLSGLAPPVTLPPPPPPQMDLHTREAARYSRWSSILTKREMELYSSLLSAVQGQFQVMCKVRLRDFIRLDNDPPERDKHLSRLSCRHVDFLLCEPKTLKPLLVIELDDGTHKSSFAEENDLYKDQLFAAARLPILRLPHPNFPPHQLRNRIEQELRMTN